MKYSSLSDPYLRRLGGAALAVAVMIVVALLLSPPVDVSRPWYEHTGAEGPTVLLENIDVVRENDPTEAQPSPTLPDATIGVAPELTERIRHEDPLDPRPLERPVGERGPRRTPLHRAPPERAEALAEADAVEMNRPAQQSSDFVLLHAVNPTYPEGVEPALRSREIVVRVNMYVDETGHVQHAYVDRNNGGAAFEEAVLGAVRQWVYRPLLVDGQPSGFWDLIYFVFRTPATEAGAQEAPRPGSGSQ